MFFKKKISEKERMEKQVKEAKAYFAFQSYHTVIRLAKTYTKNESPEDKILILNYFIDSILDDVCTSTSVAYLFNRQDGMLNPPFLSGFYDNSGAKLEIYTDKIVPVDLQKSKFYVRPRKYDSMVECLKFFRDKDFEYKENHHYSNYYPEINLCYVHGGNHSIHIGKYSGKEGTIFSEECDLCKMFPHCTTDGEKWYNSHTGEPFSVGVSDFRLAAVYTLAQMRYFIRKG